MPATGESVSRATPLWIISIFIGLSQAVAGLVAIQGSGWIAGTLAIFAVIYPIVVTGLFFLILWKRNWLFYPPSEFSHDVQPAQYIDAMRGQRIQLELGQVAIRTAVEEAAVSTMKEWGVDDEERLERVRTKTREELDKLSIDVNIDINETNAARTRFYPTDTSTVTDLLNSVYFAISDFVRPFEYPRTWVLEREGGGVLDQMGTSWARSRGLPEDDRLLGEVGIKAGDRLRARRP
jgi:hypothetical protein